MTVYPLSIMLLSEQGRGVYDERKLSLLLSTRPELLRPREKALAMGHHLCREARRSSTAQIRFIQFDTTQGVARCMFKGDCAHAEQCKVDAV